MNVQLMKRLGAVVAIIAAYVVVRAILAAGFGLFVPGKTGAVWEMLLNVFGLFLPCSYAWAFFTGDDEARVSSAPLDCRGNDTVRLSAVATAPVNPSGPPPLPVIVAPRPRRNLAGIEGWLLFWAVILPINLIVQIISLLVFGIAFFGDNTREALEMDGLTAGEVVASFICGIAVVTLHTVAMIEFYRRKRSAVPWMQALLVASLIYWIVLVVVMSDGKSDGFDFFLLLFRIAWSVIWWCYFLQSKRVKRTFVN